MRSLCRSHYQKTTAAAAKPDQPELPLRDQLLLQMRQHSRELSGMQSIKARALKKSEFIGEYVDYVDGILEGDKGGQDDIVVRVMLWSIDAGHVDRALSIAQYVLRHDLQSPSEMKRSPAVFIAEEIANRAITDDSVNLEQVMATLDMIEGRDMPDQVRAKLHKCAGNRYAAEDDHQNALQAYQTALDLDQNSGVKKMIEGLQRTLRKQSK